VGTGHFQEFEDEYLEMMYQFYEKNPESMVRNGDLAEALKVTPASTTEMVQRLAVKGFLEYVPYKGSILTEKGLKHGKKMKRRHRLAEVLLEHLPFDGNQHSTACRLEHAIDDDLEVALTIYLGNPQTDPSGTKIPDIADELRHRLADKSTSLLNLNNLEIKQMGEIKVISMSKSDKSLISNLGMKVGDQIQRVNSQRYECNDLEFDLSPSLSSLILIKVHESSKLISTL